MRRRKGMGMHVNNRIDIVAVVQFDQHLVNELFFDAQEGHVLLVIICPLREKHVDHIDDGMALDLLCLAQQYAEMLPREVFQQHIPQVCQVFLFELDVIAEVFIHGKISFNWLYMMEKGGRDRGMWWGVGGASSLSWGVVGQNR